ncbi:Tfp pilus assembly protein PilF [Paraburkholderia unamae]|uniref:tetratricopeptide repeat-containing glycosyltransferase family protein n=1 Tax=Paraburkholderia unamae TaxID=219649 RepID=UPI000DC4776B|nr:tetratricopeptide repeat-containing glycosyltransferase family protein [Paraburkholderia unamae]RAR64026.1 Tfp pilus assembly protein PilF [Paraburkholderia unamae]
MSHPVTASAETSADTTADTSATHARASEPLALADLHFQAGRTCEALLAYQDVLTREPRHAHALHRVALSYFRDGQRDLARDYLERAINVSPERAELWEHRGLLAALEKAHVVAEALYRRAIALSGGTASEHRNLADVLKLAGRRAEARMHYEKALEFDPTLHDAMRRLAALCLEDERFEEAVVWSRRAYESGASRLADGLDLLKALAGLGHASGLNAQITQMRAAFARDGAALESLALRLNEIHRFDAAYEVALQGLAVDATRGKLHHYASYALNMLGEHARMRHHADEAARLLPDDEPVQFNAAVAMLRDGDFERGWRHYHWHERLACNSTLVRPGFAEWSGEPVSGRRFLLVGEQGLGDQLQSLRYAAWLERQGATVDVWVDKAIADVAARAHGVHRVWTTLPPGAYDFWSRMFRLPEHMKLTLDRLPLAMPYLGAPLDLIERWRARLAGGEPRGARRLRVGLVWAGNPDYEFDRYRSLALRTMQPVLERGGVSWFSLQKGAAQSELEALPAGIDIAPLGREISSFMDTLAIVQSLDLVITVDTSVAHLAGAVGVPVWILLPTCTDWRWMTKRTDSPWYPSARLFRQRELGRWDEVIEEMGAALDALPPKA